MPDFIGALCWEGPDTFCKIQEFLLGYSAFHLIRISQSEGILREYQDVLMDITQHWIICLQPGSPGRRRACAGTFVPEDLISKVRNGFPFQTFWVFYQ